MYEPYAVTVLTTEERCDFFRATIGERADFHFDPYDAMPLHLFLSNIALSAGSAVVLDEDYFLSTESMVRGLRDFLDDAARSTRELRFVLVCSRRQPGDALLRHVVGYFGIYDVVYDCTVGEAAHETARLLANPNRRVDVLDLLRAPAPGEMAGGAVPFEVAGGFGGPGAGGEFDARGGFAFGGECDGRGAFGMQGESGVRGELGGAGKLGGPGEPGGSDFTIERDGFRVDISLNITPIG